MTKEKFESVFDVLTENASEETRSSLRQHCSDYWDQVSEIRNTFALLKYLRKAHLKIIGQHLSAEVVIEGNKIKITTANPESLRIIQLPPKTTDPLTQLKIARQDLLLALRTALAERSEDLRKLCGISTASFKDLISGTDLNEAA